MALAGDYIIAADTAKFTMAYTGIGTSPDGGSTYLLPRLIGRRAAMEMALFEQTHRCTAGARSGHGERCGCRGCRAKHR